MTDIELRPCSKDFYLKQPPENRKYFVVVEDDSWDEPVILARAFLPDKREGGALQSTRMPSKAVAGRKTPGASKYHVAPKEDRTYNGVVYATKGEAQLAQELDLMVKAGKITFWLRQVPFRLAGDPPITYRADFMTFKAIQVDEDGNGEDYSLMAVKVIEKKGYWKKKGQFHFTEGAKLKMKLFKQQYPNLALEIC